MAGKLRLDMDFIDVPKYEDKLLEFRKKIILEANNVWRDGVRAFVRTAGDTVLIDTAMSALSLTVPLEDIDPAGQDSEQNRALSQRKRLRATPLRKLDGTIIKGAFRKATSALQEAKRGSKVMELSFSNHILEFEYKVVVWQIEVLMGNKPVDAGFKAFEQAVARGFGEDFEKRIKIKNFLDPFKKKTMFTAKAR